MLREGLFTAWLPLADALTDEVWDLAQSHASLPMPSHTHGQPASPTTLGKELAVFGARWRRSIRRSGAIPAAGQVQRRGRYLRRPTWPPTPRWTGFGCPAGSSRVSG